MAMLTSSSFMMASSEIASGSPGAGGASSLGASFGGGSCAFSGPGHNAIELVAIRTNQMERMLPLLLELISVGGLKDGSLLEMSGRSLMANFVQAVKGNFVSSLRCLA
jgi:hypothetical protein